MNLQDRPRLSPLGDGAVIVQFGDAVDAGTHARVLGFVQALETAARHGRLAGVLEWVPAFAAVTVIVDDVDEAAAQQRDALLLALAASAAPAATSGRRWWIPACFDADLAPDLEALAQARGLGLAQLRALLAGTPLRVYMLGFMPGFPYMGDLPAALETPRLASPRKAVPARSIAVAGRLCAIYPWVSPGGWHLVGRTPARLFDAGADEPALLRSGDELRWRVVDRDEFDRLDALASAGQIDRRDWLQPAA
jgi:inhibitor of KinA